MLKTSLVITAFYIGAFFLKIYAIDYSPSFFDRVELVTPLTNVKRLKEALFLEESGLSPYTGSAFHQPPLILLLFRIPILLNANYFFSIFCDFLIAFALRGITNFYNETFEAKTDRINPPPKIMGHLVALLYLYLPFSWSTSLAQSTGIVENVFVLYSLYYALKNNLLASIVCIGIAAYISIYPVQLLVPLLLILGTKVDKKIAILLFLIVISALVFISYRITNSWEWVFASYGFTLQVTDLTPNIGLFWYFFLEIFNHFRTFFCCVLQLNCFLYTAPLSLCLRKRPVLLFWVLYTYATTLKPYPSVADLAVQFALLPLFYPIISEFLPRFVIISQIYAYCAIVMPLAWYTWLYQGSGNANFFYATTLALGIAQIWLLVEVLHTALERAYKFKHKIYPFNSVKPKVE